MELDRLARDPACAWEREAWNPGLPSQPCRLGGLHPGPPIHPVAGGAPGIIRLLPTRWAGSRVAGVGLVPAVLAEQRYRGPLWWSRQQGHEIRTMRTDPDQLLSVCTTRTTAPVSEMRKLRHQEVPGWAPSHTARKRKGGVRPGPPARPLHFQQACQPQGAADLGPLYIRSDSGSAGSTGPQRGRNA